MTDTLDTAQTATTPEAAPPSASDWFFTKALPQEYQSEPLLKNFTGDTQEEIVGKLVKSYVSAARMIGVDQNELVRIPKDPEKQGEAWDKLYSMRGRPESPDKYDVQIEGMDPEVASKYLGALHKAGASQEDVRSLVELDKAIRQEAAQKAEEAANAAWSEKEAALKQEWGAAYDAKSKAAEIVAQKYFPDIDMSVPAVKAAVLEGFAKIADAVSEDADIKAVASPASRVPTPAEAKMAIAEFEAENMKILMDPTNPLRAGRLAERDRLYRAAYGSQ